MQDAVIDFTVKTLVRTVKHERQRLDTGIALRRHLGTQIAAGIDVDHYRISWIRSSVGEIVDTLMKVGGEFNRAHPEDKISAQDFVDVLLSTVEALKGES